VAANKRTPAQIDKDRQEIARLYLQGQTQSDIAAQLKMTQPMVSYDLAAIRQAWVKSSLCDFNEAKAKELAKIDHLEWTYWQAWERSLEPFKSKTVKAKGVDREAATANAEQTIKTEDRNGDPRYLDGVMACIDRRCKIFGFDAPTKLQHSWQDSLPEGYDASEVQKQFAGLLAAAAKGANANGND